LELSMLLLSGALLLVATLLIYNTIRLAVFSKRFLLRTMQLVGAKSSFIRRPFLYRSIYQGFISGMLAITALVALWYLFIHLNPTIIVNLSTNSALLQKELMEFGIIASGILFIGVLISFGSTYFALNKYIWIKSEKLY